MLQCPVKRAWFDGVTGLRDKRVFAVGECKAGDALTGFSEPPKLENPNTTIGRSDGMGTR